MQLKAPLVACALALALSTQIDLASATTSLEPQEVALAQNNPIDQRFLDESDLKKINYRMYVAKAIRFKNTQAKKKAWKKKKAKEKTESANLLASERQETLGKRGNIIGRPEKPSFNHPNRKLRLLGKSNDRKLTQSFYKASVKKAIEFKVKKKKDKLKCIKNLKLCEDDPEGEDAYWFGKKGIAQMKHDLANKFKDMKRGIEVDVPESRDYRGLGGLRYALCPSCRSHPQQAALDQGKKAVLVKHKLYRASVKKAIKFKARRAKQKGDLNAMLDLAKEDELYAAWVGPKELARYQTQVDKLSKRSSLKHKMYRSAVKKAVKFKGKQKKALQKERVKQAKEDEDFFKWFGETRMRAEVERAKDILQTAHAKLRKRPGNDSNDKRALETRGSFKQKLYRAAVKTAVKFKTKQKKQRIQQVKQRVQDKKNLNEWLDSIHQYRVDYHVRPRPAIGHERDPARGKAPASPSSSSSESSLSSSASLDSLGWPKDLRRSLDERDFSKYKLYRAAVKKAVKFKTKQKKHEVKQAKKHMEADKDEQDWFKTLHRYRLETGRKTSDGIHSSSSDSSHTSDGSSSSDDGLRWLFTGAQRSLDKRGLKHKFYRAAVKKAVRVKTKQTKKQIKDEKDAQTWMDLIDRYGVAKWGPKSRSPTSSVSSNSADGQPPMGRREEVKQKFVFSVKPRLRWPRLKEAAEKKKQAEAARIENLKKAREKMVQDSWMALPERVRLQASGSRSYFSQDDHLKNRVRVPEGWGKDWLDN